MVTRYGPSDNASLLISTCGWTFLTLAVGIAVTGCSEPETPEEPRLLLDVSGEPATVDAASKMDALPTWHLGDQALVIGEAEAASEHMVFSRIAAALELASGNILVADGGSLELRLYSPSGRFIRSMGRVGDGPGEFRAFGFVSQCDGKDIYALNLHGSYVNIFHENGELRETVRLNGFIQGAPPLETRCFNDQYLNLGWGQGPTIPGPFRVPSRIGLASADGTLERLFGLIPGPERFGAEDGSPAFAERPLGQRVSFALGSDRFFVNVGLDAQVHILDLYGNHLGASDPAFPGRRLGQDEIDQYLSELRVVGPQNPERIRQYQRAWRERGFPEWAPPFAQFRVDNQGQLWAEVFPLPTATERHWLVMSPSGEWTMALVVPDSVRVTDVDSKRVVAVVTDLIGVERVAVYPLRPH